MKKKYMLFDVDGTLADDATKKTIPSAQKTLDRLQEAGHSITIAAGGAHYKVRDLIEASGLYNIVYYGGNGLVINDELIMNTSLDQQKAIVVYKEAHALGHGALVMPDGSIDVHDVDDRFLWQRGEWEGPTDYIFHADFGIGQAKDIYKLYISIPKEEGHRLTKKDTLGNLHFAETYLMFQRNRKEEGVLDTMEHLGSSVEDVVVLGDDYNDLIMFNDAWFSIAMGNACDALKKKTDYVTECNAGDSIYKTCLKSRWISQDFDLSSSIKKGRFIYYRSLVDSDNFKQGI